MGPLLAYLLGECLGVQDTQWKRVRKPFNHPFAAQNVENYFDLIMHTVTEWLDFGKGVGGQRDVASLCDLPFGVFARLVYGKSLAANDELRLRALLRDHDAIIAENSSLFRRLLAFFAVNSRAKTFMREWTAFNDSCWAKRGELDSDSVFAKVAPSVGSGDITKQEVPSQGSLCFFFFFSVKTFAHFFLWTQISSIKLLMRYCLPMSKSRQRR